MLDLSEYKIRWGLLRSAQVWPLTSRLDPVAWLSNFHDHERRHAMALLNGLIYFSSDACRRMFVHAVRRLSQAVVSDKRDTARARRDWSTFLDSLVVVRVTGEEPSDADSGFIFARLARDALGLKEDQIMAPEQAIVALRSGPSRAVLFVDDFAGTGNQFETLWQRHYPIESGHWSSLANVAATRPDVAFYYCPLLCAWQARDRISARCPDVRLAPAHFLETQFSALDHHSIIWPDDLRPTARDFLEKASQRAGLQDLGLNPGDWRGFGGLALTLSFEHGTPDASVGILNASNQSWKPLIRHA